MNAPLCTTHIYCTKPYVVTDSLHKTFQMRARWFFFTVFFVQVWKNLPSPLRLPSFGTLICFSGNMSVHQENCSAPIKCNTGDTYFTYIWEQHSQNVTRIQNVSKISKKTFLSNSTLTCKPNSTSVSLSRSFVKLHSNLQTQLNFSWFE